MADNLTVKSPGAGGAVPTTSSEASTGSKKAADKGREKLERLRDLVKARSGKVLSDEVLQAIIDRREAKQAHTTRIAESKTAFEEESSKATLGNRAQDIETRAQKTTGAEKTRGTDGLSERDRTSVRSDPKAGPKLPPAASRATTPEQAQKLVGKMFANLLVDGKPVDVEQYAQSLKQLPASQPKPLQQKAGTGTKQAPAMQGQAQAQAKGAAPEPGTLPHGAPKGPQPMLQTKSGSQPAPAQGQPRFGQTSSTSAAQRGPAGPTPMRQTPTQPGLPDKPGGPGRSASLPGAPPTLSLSMRGGAGKSGRANEAFNAGGGLDSDVEFDGMTFNWDAFFMRFLIESQKDLNAWKRALREMKALARQAAIEGVEFQIAFTKHMQELDAFTDTVKLANASTKAWSSAVEGSNKAYTGDSREAARRDRETREFLRRDDVRQRLGPNFGRDGRIILTQRERDRLGKGLLHEYDRHITDLRTSSGLVGYLGILRRDRALMPAAERGEIDKEINTVGEDVHAWIAANKDDPSRMAAAAQVRSGLQSRVNDLDHDITAIDRELNGDSSASPRIAAATGKRAEELRRELDNKRTERASVLAQLVEVDRLLASELPRGEATSAAVRAAAAPPEPASLPETLPADASPDVARAWYQRAQTRYLQESEGGRSAGSAPAASLASDQQPPERANAALDGMASANRAYLASRGIGPSSRQFAQSPTAHEQALSDFVTAPRTRPASGDRQEEQTTLAARFELGSRTYLSREELDTAVREGLITTEQRSHYTGELSPMRQQTPLRYAAYLRAQRAGLPPNSPVRAELDRAVGEADTALASQTTSPSGSIEQDLVDYRTTLSARTTTLDTEIDGLTPQLSSKEAELTAARDQAQRAPAGPERDAATQHVATLERETTQLRTQITNKRAERLQVSRDVLAIDALITRRVPRRSTVWFDSHDVRAMDITVHRPRVRAAHPPDRPAAQCMSLSERFDLGSRSLLTSAQLDQAVNEGMMTAEERTLYESRAEHLRVSAPLIYAAFVRDETSRLSSNAEPEVRTNLEQRLRAADEAVAAFYGRARGGHTSGAVLEQLEDYRDYLDARIAELDDAIKSADEEAARGRLQTQRDAEIRRRTELGGLLGSRPPRTRDVTAEQQRRRAMEQEVERLPADASPIQVRMAYEKAQLRYFRDTIPTNGEAPPGARGTAAPSPTIHLSQPPTERELAALQGMASAGRSYFDTYGKHEAPSMWLGVGRLTSLVAEQFASGLEQAQGDFKQTVNKVVSDVAGQARQNRTRLDQQARSQTQQAQGMINQLLQMMRLTRST